MFGIGGTEFAIILIFAFLIFGPDKLPAIAKTVGQAIAKFRDVQNEMNEVVKEEVYDPEKDKDNPFQRPLDKMANLDKREVKTETFAERKARHDRERAERQAAQARTQTQAPVSAEDAPASAAPAPDAASPVAAASGDKPAPAAKPRPKMSAAELYGTAPRKKAAPKAAPASDTSAPAEKPAPSSNGGHAPAAPTGAAPSASAKPAPSADTPEGGE